MHRLAALAVCSLLAACGPPTTKQLVPTGGSRADGTVDMSYEVGGFENARFDADQARIVAAERCRAWGYTDAGPFGGEKRQCQAPSQYGCLQWFVTVTYQCTGGKGEG